MIKIAVISAARVSLAPIEQTAAQHFPEVQLVHFVDEAMSLIAKRDGGVISPSNLCRMVSLIRNANDFGVDGVLLSCTIFSPYDELLAEFSESPLIAADVATLENAVATYNKIGVVVTFEPTLKSVGAILNRCREKIGPVHADIRLAEGAFDAAARGDADTHNKTVADCARSLAGSCEAIILTQMSHLGALPLLSDLQVPVLTTPAVSLGLLIDRINARKGK
jgi:hypothetical protein